jgi:CBS domain containing-hemolysin-like protein
LRLLLLYALLLSNFSLLLLILLLLLLLLLFLRLVFAFGAISLRTRVDGHAEQQTDSKSDMPANRLM